MCHSCLMVFFTTLDNADNREVVWANTSSDSEERLPARAAMLVAQRRLAS